VSEEERDQQNGADKWNVPQLSDPFFLILFFFASLIAHFACSVQCRGRSDVPVHHRNYKLIFLRYFFCIFCIFIFVCTFDKDVVRRKKVYFTSVTVRCRARSRRKNTKHSFHCTIVCFSSAALGFSYTLAPLRFSPSPVSWRLIPISSHLVSSRLISSHLVSCLSFLSSSLVFSSLVFSSLLFFCLPVVARSSCQMYLYLYLVVLPRSKVDQAVS